MTSLDTAAMRRVHLTDARRVRDLRRQLLWIALGPGLAVVDRLEVALRFADVELSRSPDLDAALLEHHLCASEDSYNRTRLAPVR